MGVKYNTESKLEGNVTRKFRQDNECLISDTWKLAEKRRKVKQEMNQCIDEERMENLSETNGGVYKGVEKSARSSSIRK